MASLRKDPRGFSKYWYACITIPGKGQTQRSTKVLATERNRGEAMTVAGRWEREAKHLGSAFHLQSPSAILEAFVSATQKSTKNELTVTDGQEIMDRLLEATGRGRGAASKTPVIGLLKRGGKVFTSVVVNCSRAALEPIIKGQVLSKSTVYTDGWLGYDGLLLSGYKHHRIFHHENEFAQGKNHVTGIESFWSFAKFRFTKLRGVRKEFFVLHLKESERRWSHRRDNLSSTLSKNLRLNPL